MRTMHLFAGVGGGLLADLILGHTPVVAVEWESYACQVLRERAADGWFPDLSVWEGDVRLFDPSEYADKVDCIHAGFPCQDISVAGKQAGIAEGTRSGLYREVLRIADIVRPRHIFLENVAAITSKGLDQVVKDLAQMGYDCRWLCIRASDVGAPHHRDRWFLLADSGGRRLSQQNGREIQQQGRSETIGTSENVADSSCEGLQGAKFSHYNDAKTERGKESATGTITQCSSDDWGYWSVESNMGRVANGVPNRVHCLKGLGNAQVPLQAAVAYRLLSNAA